jgi:predicted lipoprotein with Yx(FWY)xxD motif
MRAHLVILPLAGVLSLAAACGSSTPASSPAAGGSSRVAAASPGAVAVTGLKLGTTSLGKVVTDQNGLTLYLFTKDTRGSSTSACTGPCLSAWPPALAGASLPTLDGVSGQVATIQTPGGGNQVTLDGWPLYYYVKDKAAGDVTGQNVQGVWFVLDAAGKPVTATAQEPAPGY